MASPKFHFLLQQRGATIMEDVMSKQKYREVLGRCICKYLDETESTDILQEFENSKEIIDKTNKMGGDVFSNPAIQKLEDDAFELIKLTIKNLKLHTKQMIPLWLIKSGETNRKK
jgi:hypothetical protein